MSSEYRLGKTDKEVIAELQQELQAYKIQEQNRHAHLQFMAKMFSHNLRSPIAGIKMLLSLYHRVSSDERQEIFESFEEASEMLSTMINDLSEVLLDYRLLENPLEVIYPEAIFREIKSKYANEIAECNAHIHMETEVDEIHYRLQPLIVILTELISNTLKFCPQTRSPNVTIRFYREENKIMLAIIDNGLGIDLAMFERDVFKMYKSLQLGNAVEPPKGRGLFRVKNLVEICGGKVSLTSKPGHGTSIIIELYRD